MVAPLVGAWIEIKSEIYKVLYVSSLLSWERGLKLLIHHNQFYLHLRRSSRGSVDWNYKEVPQYELSYTVAPLVGAWIEIFW